MCIHNRMGYNRNQQKLLLFHQLSICQYGLQFLEVYVEQGCTISTCYNFHVTGYRCCGHINFLGHLYGCYPQWTNNCILPIHITSFYFAVLNNIIVPGPPSLLQLILQNGSALDITSYIMYACRTNQQVHPS